MATSKTCTSDAYPSKCGSEQRHHQPRHLPTGRSSDRPTSIPSPNRAQPCRETVRAEHLWWWPWRRSRPFLSCSRLNRSLASDHRWLSRESWFRRLAPRILERGDVSVPQGEVMRIIMIPLIVALASCSVQPPASTERTAAPPADGGTVTARLSDFAFDPEHIRLKAGTLVRLRFVNESDNGHDFSAPSFVAASSFLPGSPAPVDGAVEVASHQTVEIALIPNRPGTYPFECTHFLHSTFGMHGTVEVIP